MESMDLFGEALYDFHKGAQKGKFFLVDGKGNKFELNLGEYFRSINEITDIEKILFNNINGGDVLDIGCGTAFYFPLIQKNANNVEGIDISEYAIKVAIERGIKNVKQSDIFLEKIHKKYDIITLLGNNLSIGGDIEGTNKFLSIIKSLLKKDGKILSILKKEEDEDYFIGEFFCEYNGKTSENFKWIRFNINFLKGLLNKNGLKLNILGENNYGYCLEIKYT
nr:class I SAM-dependent methyltransferase [Candidatus Gracilibacteria bacterium]